MLEQILFWLLAGGAILTAAMVVLPPVGRNPLYGALSLILSFFFISGLYVLLVAHVMAVLQVLVYAGAIMVLFIFVIMLLNLSDKELGQSRKTTAQFIGVLAVSAIAVKAIMVVSSATGSKALMAADAGFGTVDGLADLLFRQFLFPFELVSILLLVAVIGAVVLAKRRLT